jgi:hypothetical protein
MKRPDKIIKWFHVEPEPERIYVDYNGKPSCSYIIRIPYWLGRAYKLNCRQVKIEIRESNPSMKNRIKEETNKEYHQYFKENWLNKMNKMRKLNHNYTLISHHGKGTGWFKSMDDYNNYHKELQKLNEKYGVKRPE